MPRVRSIRCALIIAASGVGTGCLDHDRSGFRDVDPACRFRAVHAAAVAGDRSAIPSLINGLMSDDPAERLLCIHALRQLTGQTLEYDHWAPRPERVEAAERWRSWYAQQGPRIAMAPSAAVDPLENPDRIAR